MCDFRVGDEVVFIGQTADPSDPYFPFRRVSGLLTKGSVYTVEGIVLNPFLLDDVGLLLVGVKSPHPTRAFCWRGFRKVERKTDRVDLTEWLSQPSDFEEPNRPVTPRKRVSA